ncbi:MULTISPECIES: LacI family DNA-binding transcriptional regulator [Halocynthiibacter]|uniref:LacI family transcriptional regulator n=1 Tax=Halocynthiibacter halioticoli TaxID=2986804 RepID=A0AAE3J332_9RHOB|nr:MULTISPECIES: LacI family DNA-binding transcriptional regulator [Halocynthiibacter]MCV6825481.1 LacI family transcriptional regulator [Halocynthiibacter halioticoli]MCW4058482.1 LacI family transcriptional regulator [Halocynthiibacter sp. SDUM655004]
MAGRVTIKSIAKDLGISHMTVSRALSNHPNVLKETREAVQKRAQELGYVKSAAAMAMRGGGTKIVGLLLPNIVNEFYARFANTMALACEEHSYQLLIHLTNDDLKAESLALEGLREIQAEAVVMVPAPGGTESTSTHLDGMRVIQLIRQRKEKDPASAILVDDAPAIREAVQHLADKGHRHIAYIGADSALSSGRSRLASFRQGLAQAELPEETNLIQTGVPSFEMGREHTAEILQQKQATALICGGFEISNGALNAFMDASEQSAPQMSFVGYGDPSFYSWINGGISTIRVPVDRLARKAVDILVSSQTDGPSNPLTFEAQLVVRK